MITRIFLKRFWLGFATTGVVVVLLGASAFVLETLPPRTLVMATGAQGGANYELSMQYRDILAQSGVKLQLLPTTGA